MKTIQGAIDELFFDFNDALSLIVIDVNRSDINKRSLIFIVSAEKCNFRFVANESNTIN